MFLFRKILSFRSPIIHKLEYIDIVVEDKVLLLLAWDFKTKYSVRIPSIRRTYHLKTGAIVVKLSSHLDKLLVVVRNGWRSKRIQIQLAKVKLDHLASSMLIQQFQPFLMPTLRMNKPFVSKQIIGVELSVMEHKISSISIKGTIVSFKEGNFSYTN